MRNMGIIKIKRMHIKILIDYILVLFALIIPSSPLGVIHYSKCVILFFLVTVIIFAIKRKNLYKNSVIFICALCILMLSGMFVNLDIGIDHYIGKVLTLFFPLLIISIIKKESLKNIYINLVVIISVYSIVITLYLNLIDISSLFNWNEIIDVESGGGWKTLGYLYNAWGTNAWTSVVRNSGFFREPGVMGMHTCLASVFLLEALNYRKKLAKREWYKLAVLMLAGVLTLSTVAILGLLLISLLYFVKIDKLTNKHLVLMMIVFAVGAVILTKNYDVLFRKFNPNNYEYMSVSDRTSGLKNAFDIALDSPIFGVGYSTYTKLSTGVVTFYFVDLWAKYGIFYSFIVTYGIFRMITQTSKNNKDFIIITAIISMFLFSQGFADTPIYLLFELIAIGKKNYTFRGFNNAIFNNYC